MRTAAQIMVDTWLTLDMFYDAMTQGGSETMEDFDNIRGLRDETYEWLMSTKRGFAALCDWLARQEVDKTQEANNER